MSNMSHCRFENTCQDLQDCQVVLEDLFNGETDDGLSETESKKANELVEMCQDIVQLLADQAGVEVNELTDEMINMAIDTANNEAKERAAEAEDGDES